MIIENTMAIDQHGTTFHGLGDHPRSELLKRLDRKSAQKMYVDSKSGPKHIGYIISGRWLTLYVVNEWIGDR